MKCLLVKYNLTFEFNTKTSPKYCVFAPTFPAIWHLIQTFQNGVEIFRKLNVLIDFQRSDKT